MSKKEYTLTSGQLLQMKMVFVVTSSKNEVDLSKRLALIEMLEFTEEELERVNYSVETGPLGAQDQTSYKADVELTRRFTSGQRKKLLEVCKEAMPKLQHGFYAQWILPAMQALGYELPEPKWEDED